MSQKRVKKPKRHIRKSIIVALVLCISVIVLAFGAPRIIKEAKLKDLGYDAETSKLIIKEDLADKIISNKYYSKYLAQSIRDHTLDKNYLSLYASITTERTLEAKDFLLYNRLLDKGYETDQLENLFSHLSFYEITPLLIFDYQWDENPYIEDCTNNRDTNSETAFSLSDTYIKKYKLQKQAAQGTTTVLVNSTYGLQSDYIPADLTDISTQYAVNDVQLTKEVADAFTAFAQAGVQTNHNFFATTGYRSYEIQESAYNSFLGRMSESEADSYSIRPGHSEHQTGLAVNVAATFETSVAFKETQTYQWMLENCADYGFIQRYPEGKSQITGFADETEHFRYVGKDLAKKIQESSLTYDEYYCLYLAEWEEAKDKPSKKVLKQLPDYSTN